MQMRHRVPTIFNLSMVDVLCCALGCVILLWLLNFREAKRRALAAGETVKLLAESNQEAAGLRADLAAAEQRGRHALALLEDAGSDRDRAYLLAARAEQEHDATRRALALARGQLADRDAALKDARARNAAYEEGLAGKARDQAELTKELTAARQRNSALETLLKEQKAQTAGAARNAAELNAGLQDAEARAKLLRARADSLGAEAKAYQEKLAAADRRLLELEKDIAGRKKEMTDSAARLATLEEARERLVKEVAERNRELAAARRNLGAVQDEKKALRERADRLQAAAAHRFEGIELTGKRVVFLVDMSGSMELLDLRTLAPNKWAGVNETLGKLMRSLPGLEKFQVIIFSDKASFLLGGDGRWLDFDPKTSVERTTKALAAIKPEGETNLHAALAAAFRLRADGLDTIYLLSDGIPNAGEGLPPNAQNLKETDRAEILGKYMRRVLRSDWNRPQPGRPRVRINTIGFFYESPDVGAFLWALARENDGSFVGMSRP
jgi:hypothetical protein